MANEQTNPGKKTGLAAEFSRCWGRLPDKGLFFGLLAAWLFLFQFWGNATFGYVDTSSLMGWMYNAYNNPGGNGEDSHGNLIPFVVLALFWWKRNQLLEAPHRVWWPALVGLALALVAHALGYLTQQPLISIVAFFGGIYMLIGLVWGPVWLRRGFFPFFLFVFCLPMSTIAQPITFPLRNFVAGAVTVVSHGLGLDVVREGTILHNEAGTYNYDVAAPCSGLRSLIAIVALGTVFGFMTFDKNWKRLLIIALAVPLAMIGNVARMMTIILAAEISGQAGGNYVHTSAFFSIVPYVPAFLGIFLLGHFLREPEPASPGLPLKPKTV